MPPTHPDRGAAASQAHPSPPETTPHDSRRPSLLADRYWCAHAWVEVLPDGTSFITPYDGGQTDTGTLAARTEAALATVAFRIDRQLPLVRTAAWSDPARCIPALDERSPSREADDCNRAAGAVRRDHASSATGSHQNR